jgi:hypothetical protein
VEQVIAAAPPHIVWDRADPDDHDVLEGIDEDQARTV